MTKKSIPRKIMASVLVLMMLFATTGLVMADSITITSFEKIEEEDGGLNPSMFQTSILL
jgi:hypothetical protein